MNNFWTYLIVAVLLLAGLMTYHAFGQGIVIDNKQWSCGEDTCEVTFEASNQSGDVLAVRFYYRAMVWTDSSYGELLGVLFEDTVDAVLTAESETPIAHTLNKPRNCNIDVIQVSFAVLSE